MTVNVSFDRDEYTRVFHLAVTSPFTCCRLLIKFSKPGAAWKYEIERGDLDSDQGGILRHCAPLLCNTG